MKHSPEIGQIAVSLAAVQPELRAIMKDSTNPHFKSKFASLDTIIDTVRPLLAQRGLSILQSAEPSDDGIPTIIVETMLLHASGEWLSNTVLVPLAKNDPQGAGAALTYGRRYGLSALLCLATDEDDDGNTASTRPAAATTPARAPSQNGGGLSAGGNDVPASDRVMPFGKTKGAKISDHTTEQLRKTMAWCKETDAEKFKDLITHIRSVLADRALGDSPDQRLQTVLHHGEDNDGLPF